MLPQFDQYAAGTAVETAVAVQVTASDSTGATRQNVSMTVVLDVSGSMQTDGKLGHCIETVRFIMTQLTPRDRLAVITFNRSVYATSMVVMDAAGKAYIEAELARFCAKGQTNLSGALIKAITQLKSLDSPRGERMKVSRCGTAGLCWSVWQSLS